MKKQYIKSHAEKMRYDIEYYFKMISFYNRDVARASRIESELLSLADDAIDTAHNFTGINPRELIIELRDPKHVDKALYSIAWHWKHATLSKDQRALLGKDTMRQIKSIYKTL
jgi:hypothetical protein